MCPLNDEFPRVIVVVKPLCGFEEPDELDMVEELPSSLSGGMSSTEESDSLSDCTLTSLLFFTGDKRSVIDHNTHTWINQQNYAVIKTADTP